MITVCLATYNGARHIAEQLQSILAQLGTDDEVIVSDDGSTDPTLDIVRQMAGTSATPIRITLNPGEHGYTANFEHALSQARGEYVFLSDQDDVWLPGKVATMLHALHDEGYDLCVSNARITDAELNVTYPDYYAARGVYRGLLGNFVKFGYLGCCLALTRRQLGRSLPFPADRRYCTHDNWLFVCALAMGRVKILDEALMLYRRHGNTQTTGAFNAHKPLSFRIRYRLYLAWQLMVRTLNVKLHRPS